MRSSFCLIFVGMFASSSLGEWRTSDQVFSIVWPNSDRFREVQPEAPFSMNWNSMNWHFVHWNSIGGFAQLHVVESAYPNAASEVRMDQSLEGFAAEAGTN